MLALEKSLQNPGISTENTGCSIATDDGISVQPKLIDWVRGSWSNRLGNDSPTQIFSLCLESNFLLDPPLLISHSFRKLAVWGVEFSKNPVGCSNFTRVNTVDHFLEATLTDRYPKNDGAWGKLCISGLQIAAIFWAIYCWISEGGKGVSGLTYYSRWWFQIFFIFTPIWGRFPFWLIFFKWVETT